MNKHSTNTRIQSSYTVEISYMYVSICAIACAQTVLNLDQHLGRFLIPVTPLQKANNCYIYNIKTCIYFHGLILTHSAWVHVFRHTPEVLLFFC